MDDKTSRYPAFLRVLTIATITLAAAFLVDLAYFLYRFIDQVYRYGLSVSHDWPFYLYVSLVGTLAEYVTIRMALSGKLFLDRVWLEDTKLRVKNHLDRDEKEIDLSDVVFVSSYYIIGPSKRSVAVRGHVLDTGTHRIRVSEALPLWPEIRQKCASAEFQTTQLLTLRTKL